MHTLRITLAVLSLGAPAAAHTLEFFQGPIVSSNRVIGLGGAYIAVAEGTDGHLVNPVAWTLRSRESLDTHFDWDAGFSMLSLSSGEALDIDQSGATGLFDRGYHLQLGGNLKFGRHGFGIQGTTQTYELSVSPDEIRQEDIRYAQSFTTVGYAYAFLDGALTCGVSISLVSARLGPQDDTETNEDVVVSGGGLLLGVLWAPPEQAFRLGATARNHMPGEDVTGQSNFTALDAPERITAPWQLGLGGAYMLGPRVFNPKPSFGAHPEGQAPKRIDAHRYVLLAADLVATGPSGAGTIGTQGYLRNQPRAVGQSTTIALRMGAESEVIERLLRLRGGSYYEPSRFEDGGRIHGTLGFDLRAPLWFDWKINAVIDIADGYINGGVGVGLWH
jgi:hypothetical protein